MAPLSLSVWLSYRRRCSVLTPIRASLLRLTKAERRCVSKRAIRGFRTLFKSFPRRFSLSLIQLRHLLCSVFSVPRSHSFRCFDVLLTRPRSTEVMAPSTSLSTGKKSDVEERADSGAERNPTDSLPAPSSSAKALLPVQPPNPKPSLRSVPAAPAGKAEPTTTPSPIVPSTTVVDVDDWCDNGPLDHAEMMKDVFANIESPPNELESVDSPNQAAAAVTAPCLNRSPPPRGLPVGSLPSHWQNSAKPLSSISTEYLQRDDLRRRVDVSVLRATEQYGRGNDGDSTWYRGAKSRFVEVHKGYYSIPTGLKCDRSFIEQPGDAIYIERMCTYLFSEAEELPPICTDARLYEVVVTADKAKIQRHQLMWAILLVKHKVVTFEDFFTSRRLMVDISKAAVPNPETDPLLCVPWDFFPTVPKWLLESVDLRSAHMTPIRALVFFTNVARRAGVKVFKRWNKSLQLELAIHTTVAHYTAWARPVIDQSRIWFPEVAHVQWLKGFVHLPPIPVYYESLNKYVTVTVREVVTILEDTLARATPLSRKDYRTKTLVKFVATPNAQVYTLDPLREAVLKPAAAKPTLMSQPSALSRPANPKPSSPPVLNTKGVLSGRIVKREWLRKNTSITPELLNCLRGSGPWNVVEIVDQLVAHGDGQASTNKGLSGEVSNLKGEVQRLREDMDRYRNDAARLSDELRLSRENHYYNSYPPSDTRRADDYNRGYTTRNPYDPYERRY